MFSITKFDFETKAPDKISKLTIENKKVGENWPVLYVINYEFEVEI